MDCTTLARVKAMLKTTTVESDAVIASIIASVSAAFVRETLDRHFQQVERTEVYSLRPHARLISLKGAPCVVTDVRGVTIGTIEVKASASMDFASSPTLVRNTDYVIEQDRGVLRMLASLPTFTGALGRAVSPAYVRVKYTGGLAATTADLIANYADIAGACDTQVVYEFRRRTEPGAGDSKAGDSMAVHTREVALLEGVRDTLKRYKRRGG